jgi:uncharacterized protein YkwD
MGEGRWGGLRRAAGLAALAAVLAAVLVVGCGATAFRWPWQPPPPPERPARPARGDGDFAARLRALVDAERARHGLRPLASSRCARDLAVRWAGQLASSGALRHRPIHVIRTTCRARFAGENIGLTTGSPERLMQQWMASGPHRRQILDPRVTYLGIGAARSPSGRWYAVQDFLAY